MLLEKKYIKMVSCPADIRIFYKVGSGREMAKWINQIEQSPERDRCIYEKYVMDVAFKLIEERTDYSLTVGHQLSFFGTICHP